MADEEKVVMASAPQEVSWLTDWLSRMGVAEEGGEGEEGSVQSEAAEEQTMSESEGFSFFAPTEVVTAQPQKEEPKGKKKPRSVAEVAEEIERLKAELAYREMANYFRQTAEQIENSLLASVPIPQQLRTPIVNEARRQVIAQLANASPQEQVAKFPELYQKALQQQIDTFAQSLKELGVNLPTSRMPLSVPPTNTPSLRNFPAEEEYPGQRLALDENVDVYVVPPAYLEKLRKKAREEFYDNYVRQLQERRKGAITSLVGSMVERVTGERRKE